ncbi:MAG: hypothetical protein NXI24_16060 [bacterium]|nr:hypothetical protein [bacterium]
MKSGRDQAFLWRLDRGPLWRLLMVGLFAANLAVLGVIAHHKWEERPRVPSVSRFQPDIQEFRRLAQSSRGPTAVRRLKVAEVVERGRRISINSFQLIYGSRRNRSTIVIDTGLDARLFREFGGSGEFYPEAYERLQRELLRTRAVYVTRESYDHTGGVSRSADLYGIRDRLRFTQAQARSPQLLKDARFPPTVLEAITTIACERICSPAPGLVLFPAPGDAPGAQWIYLRGIDGLEMLLVGDRSIAHKQIESLEPDSRAHYWLADRDAEDLAHRLRALHDLQKAAPALSIVPVHDEARIAVLIATETIGDGFEYDSPFGSD